jgi:hypothetical protein
MKKPAGAVFEDDSVICPIIPARFTPLMKSMARARKLKSGADAHDFTREERAKGGRARAEKLREGREAAQAFADEQLQAVLAEASVSSSPRSTRAASGRSGRSSRLRRTVGESWRQPGVELRSFMNVGSAHRFASFSHLRSGPRRED